MSTAPVYSPFVVVPPLTSCETAIIVFGQGRAPYALTIIPPGQSTVLETLPVQAQAGSFVFTVDFNPGANLTFVAIDSSDPPQVAFSEFRVVQTGRITSCPKNVYAPVAQPSNSNSTGAIVGGVVGAIVAVLLLVAAFLFYRRRQRRADQPTLKLHSANSSVHDLGPQRSGTFNLASVAFTEPSLERRREEENSPPVYSNPPRVVRQESIHEHDRRDR